jgi:hypothetical protein
MSIGVTPNLDGLEWELLSNPLGLFGEEVIEVIVMGSDGWNKERRKRFKSMRHFPARVMSCIVVTHKRTPSAIQSFNNCHNNAKQRYTSAPQTNRLWDKLAPTRGYG